MMRLFSPAVSKLATYATQRFSKPELLVKLAKETIHWSKTGNVLKPYKASIGSHELQLRINDFPDEPLYTVLHDNEEILHIDGFQSNWISEKPSFGL